MTARLPSLCLVFLSLQVGSGSSVEFRTFSGVSGGNTTFPCIFHSSGALKFFCRETCEGENLLIRTSDAAAQIGRYRTQYVKEASTTFSVLYVSISELTRSDAGRYRCGLGDSSSSSSASFQDFRLVVVDVSQQEGFSPSSLFPAVDPSRPTPTPQRFGSSSDVPVVVGATLAALVVLISAALLVSCRRRSLRGLMTRGLKGSVTESLTYENCCPEDPEDPEDPQDPEGPQDPEDPEDPQDPEGPQDPEDPTYQSLNPSSQDQNQIYSELTRPKGEVGQFAP